VPPPSVAQLKARLREHADEADAAFLQGFFKTGPGEYGEGDVFIGVRVPDMRRVCREAAGAPLAAMRSLLRSPVHEDRTLALLLLVQAFVNGDDERRQEIYDLYLANTRQINNWDLVDLSAGPIVGACLANRKRTPLTKLARSPSLWERRIAIVATHHFIRRGELDETFRIADLLLHDPHDLIHKAVGWMLREAGKRDAAALRAFLRDRYRGMPRTMLRYAIERFDEAERRQYLKGEVVPGKAASSNVADRTIGTRDAALGAGRRRSARKPDAP
jgi:3-methyladenine DNA glycosylase AlkD